jgi:hypothetical protein
MNKELILKTIETIENLKNDRKDRETVLKETVYNFNFDSEDYPVMLELGITRVVKEYREINELVNEMYSPRDLLYIASGTMNIDGEITENSFIGSQFLKGFHSKIWKEKIAPVKNELFLEIEKMILEIAKEVSSMYDAYNEKSEEINETLMDLYIAVYTL